jgi:hypothetical protein
LTSTPHTTRHHVYGLENPAPCLLGIGQKRKPAPAPTLPLALLAQPVIRSLHPIAIAEEILFADAGSLGQQLSKVTVLGAAGGIGQPLSLLLKLNPLVTELALYDIRGGPGTSSVVCLVVNWPRKTANWHG